jgi:nuclear GTP-binding protein
MILLRGVVRVENVNDPSQYIAVMLERCQTKHIERTYGIKNWTSDEDFLETLARKSGRLLKGGEADQDAVARMVLNDFLRGKLPWYVPPPRADGGELQLEGRRGRLGEMKAGTKRKADEIESAVDEDEFEGFDSEAEVTNGEAENDPSANELDGSSSDDQKDE